MSDRRAVVHIFSSYNNVLMTATDLTGAETITTCSGGQVVKTASDSGGQFAATRAAERLADALREKEFTQLIIKYRAPGGNKANTTGPGAQAAIRALTRAGMTITRSHAPIHARHERLAKSRGTFGRKILVTLRAKEQEGPHRSYPQAVLHASRGTRLVCSLSTTTIIWLLRDHPNIGASIAQCARRS